MDIFWSATSLVIAFYITKANGQECGIIQIGPPDPNDPQNPDRTFSGSIEVSDAQYFLFEDDGSKGINFLAGCATDPSIPVQLQIDPSTGTEWFVLEESVLRVDSKTLQLKPNVEYANLLRLPDLFDIVIQACEVDDPSNCATASVAITIKIYNVKAPEFNHPYGHGQIDLGSCPGEGQCNIPVVLDKTIKANDGDGSGVGIVYTHDIFTPHATLFETSSGGNSELVVTYQGRQNSFSTEGTQVVLLVQAEEQRPDGLKATIPLVVDVTGVQPSPTTSPTSTTSSTSPRTCNDDLEKKYFIAMIVLGAVLGGLLAALFIILLCLCCRRLCSGTGSSDFTATSTKISTRQSGVMAEGAAFRSFKDTTYLTLQEQHSPVGSTTDSPRVSYEPRTRYSDSESTASVDAGWRRRSKD